MVCCEAVKDDDCDRTSCAGLLGCRGVSLHRRCSYALRGRFDPYQVGPDLRITHLRIGRGAFAFRMRTADIQEAEKQTNRPQDRCRDIRWRGRRFHDAAGIHHGRRGMKRFAVHEVLQGLNSLVILGVVRRRREGRFRQSFRNAGMETQVADLCPVGIVKTVGGGESAEPAHDVVVRTAGGGREVQPLQVGVGIVREELVAAAGNEVLLNQCHENPPLLAVPVDAEQERRRIVTQLMRCRISIVRMRVWGRLTIDGWSRGDQHNGNADTAVSNEIRGVSK